MIVFSTALATNTVCLYYLSVWPILTFLLFSIISLTTVQKRGNISRNYVYSWTFIWCHNLVCKHVYSPLPEYVQNTIVEASVQLPPSLFSSMLSSGQADDGIYKLQLLAFRNGKLFPPTGNSTKRRSVVTPVILTKIGKLHHLKPAPSSAQLLVVE